MRNQDERKAKTMNAPMPANAAPAGEMVKEIITDYDEWLAAKDEREIDYMVSAGLVEDDATPTEAR